MATPDTNPQPFSFAKLSGANRDIGFAVGMVLILAMLFIPLPPFFLDLGLESLNQEQLNEFLPQQE